MSRLGRIANRLRRASNESFWVEQTDQIEGDPMQAAAFPDGNKVKVTTGLVNRLTDDELAYVIGHEIAHLEGGHAARLERTHDAGLSIAKASVRAVDRALERSGVGMGRRIVGALTSAVITGAAAGLGSLKQSRDLEREADDRGQEISSSAGYDPEAAASAIAKIDGGLNDPGLIQKLTSTHPSSCERYLNLSGKSH